jgi:hypothetical protein
MGELEKSLISLVPAFAELHSCPKIKVFTMKFSRLNPKITIVQKPRNFRFEACKQTYNPEISLLAQKFINRR